jgi:hypothetical protein
MSVGLKCAQQSAFAGTFDTLGSETAVGAVTARPGFFIFMQP